MNLETQKLIHSLDEQRVERTANNQEEASVPTMTRPLGENFSVQL